MKRKPDIRELLLGHHGELPQQQQLVADYLLENFEEAPFLSVPLLAERAGVSEATVVRLAQRLGFDGFSSLKARLLEGVREKIVRRPPGPPAGDLFVRPPKDDTLTAIALQEIDNVRSSVAGLEQDLFRQAATAIYRADQTYSFGLGISSYLAGLLAYSLTQIGLRATALSSQYSSPLEQLVPLRPSDVVVAFSLPPYSAVTIDLVRRAAARGIKTIAVTDRAAAPIAGAAAIVLPVRTDNVLHTNSLGAASVLINALATEVARADEDRAAAAVSRITEILASNTAIVKETP